MKRTPPSSIHSVSVSIGSMAPLARARRVAWSTAATNVPGSSDTGDGDGDGGVAIIERIIHALL
jgi:hypothetical protein